MVETTDSNQPIPVKTQSSAGGLLRQVVADVLETCDIQQGKDLQTQFVQHAGAKTGELLEMLYRSQEGLDREFDAETYGRLVTEIIQASGCTTSVQIMDNHFIRFVTRNCPYYDSESQDSQACNLVHNVIGSIGARNFDYTKVEFHREGEAIENICEQWICLDPSHAAHQPGIEYLREDISPHVLSPVNCLSLPPTNLTLGIEPQPIIVGKSQQMHHILSVLNTVAPTAATVLITGETGTGKECVARALHGLSDRARGEFVGVNCGAIPENLIESALFGHERGAFTSAHAKHIGYFERANGGTLFLDEVDSLSPEAQVRLLRILQEGQFERVGGRQTLRSGARIVAATNAQLPTALESGKLRSDLFYRLNVVNIHIPPLRARPDDIPVLVDHILGKFNQRYGGRVTALGEHAKRSLMEYHWPGNVRELESVLERSYLFASGSRLDTVIFDLEVPYNTDTTPAAPPSAPETTPWKCQGKAALLEQERRALEAALVRHQGNVSRVAEAMGYSRRAIYLKLATHAIDPKIYRS